MSFGQEIPLSPYLLVAVAGALEGTEADGGSGGSLVRTMLVQSAMPLNGPWGTAFVSHVGFRSHVYGPLGESAWPLPLTGKPGVLADFAESSRIARVSPEVGDVALVWSRRHRGYTQAGVVVEALMSAPESSPRWSASVTTIEGNVTPHGKPAGRGIYRVARRITRASGMMFIRWVDLDGRSALGTAQEHLVLVPGTRALRQCA